MSQRRNEMSWIWSLLVLYSGPVWKSVSCGALPNPSNKPTAVIESQAKFFQYRHLPTSEDFDQGHRLGSEDHFTERHERSRPSSGLYNAKVRWGDKKGGYGEHYWDLNHAGHNNKHDDDNYQPDGHHDDHDSHDEPSEQSTQYEDDIQEDVTNYADNEREKNANTQKNYEDLEEQRKQDVTREIYNQNIQPLKIQKRQSQEQNSDRQKNDIVLIVNQKERETQEKSRRPQQFVPYERDSAHMLRHDQSLHTLTPASLPKLYFEPSTGHVIDRTTGQAYLLHPINVNN